MIGPSWAHELHITSAIVFTWAVISNIEREGASPPRTPPLHLAAVPSEAQQSSPFQEKERVLPFLLAGPLTILNMSTFLILRNYFISLQCQLSPFINSKTRVFSLSAISEIRSVSRLMMDHSLIGCLFSGVAHKIMVNGVSDLRR